MADAHGHPTGVMDPTPCTPQLGGLGPWSDRIPHFRMGFTPSSGEEIQSEYLLPRRHAVEAFAAVRGLSSRIQPLLFVTEIRTVAADQLWMSMNYREDSVALQFTWKREQDAVERITAEIEEALAPFHMRPHWGKLFQMNAATIATLYEPHGDFVRLQERLDRAAPSAISGSSPMCSATPKMDCSAIPGVEGAERDRTTARARVWPGPGSSKSFTQSTCGGASCPWSRSLEGGRVCEPQRRGTRAHPA